MYIYLITYRLDFRELPLASFSSLEKATEYKWAMQKKIDLEFDIHTVALDNWRTIC